MIDYIRKIKVELFKTYGFQPIDPNAGELIYKEGQVPDGEYPMVIDGKKDNVKIINGYFHCCNFEELT